MAATSHRTAEEKLCAWGLRHFEVQRVTRSEGREYVTAILQTALPKPRQQVLVTCLLRRGRVVEMEVDV